MHEQTIIFSPISIVCGVNMLICVTMIVFSLWLRVRISKAFFNGLRLLEKLNLRRIH